MSIAEKSTKKH